MNALIHPIGRIEGIRIPIKPPGLLRRAWNWFAAALHTSRQRRVLTELANLDDHLLKDIGLTRNDVQTIDAKPLSDGRWVVENWR